MLELSFFQRFLIFIVGMGLGFVCLLKSLAIVNIIGKSAWAEQKLPGGTYGAVKLAGIFLMIISIVLFING